MYCESYMSEVPMSSGWATDQAISGADGCLTGSWGAPHDEGGVVLYSHNGKVVVDGGDECRHVLCVGATGTGKSRLIIMPSLLYSLSARNRRSLIVFDVKGELRAATADYAQARGYELLDINFRDPDKGDGWNPFARANHLYKSRRAENRQHAWKLVEDIIAALFNDGGEGARFDPYWRTTSGNMFRGICSVLWETGHSLNFKSILELSRGLTCDREMDSFSELFRLESDLPDSSVSHRSLAGFRNGSNQTRGNVLSCYNGYLSALSGRDDVLNMISARRSMNFQCIGTAPTMLYVTLPDDTTALGGLQGILLTQLMQELNECAMASEGLRLPVRTDIYLDELCNIHPAVPSLATSLTIGRSRGIRYILAIQSYAQLTAVYAQEAETISSNCNWISLNVSKDETFRSKLSSLCGYNALGDALIKPSELAQLRYEEGIIIRDRCAPYFTQLEDLDKIRNRLAAMEKRQGLDLVG